MDVTVVIPTYKTGNSIFKLLDSLKAQSYKKFNVLLIYKPWEGGRLILEKIREYDLDIKIAKQPDGYFEEAMNVSYGKADGEIVIHTDDDAYTSKDWIKEHVELHRKHRKVGIATGVVDESRLPDGREVPALKKFMTEQKWRMNKHTIIDKPIDDRFKDYGMYIGRSGMVVDTGRNYNMIKTFKQHGVNMSWKQEALHGFKFPGYAKVTLRNEQGAALEAISRGFDAIWFNKAKVFHPFQSSESRSLAILSPSTEFLISDVLLSYYISRFYDVELDVLRLRTNIDDFFARIMTFNGNRGYRIGYEIASGAILGKWPASRVRAEEIRRLREG